MFSRTEKQIVKIDSNTALYQSNIALKLVWHKKIPARSIRIRERHLYHLHHQSLRNLVLMQGGSMIMYNVTSYWLGQIAEKG